MNKKDSNKQHVSTTTVFAISALSLGSAAIICIAGYEVGYMIGYMRGIKHGADGFANAIVEHCPEAADILIKAGAIIKK